MQTKPLYHYRNRVAKSFHIKKLFSPDLVIFEVLGRVVPKTIFRAWLPMLLYVGGSTFLIVSLIVTISILVGLSSGGLEEFLTITLHNLSTIYLEGLILILFVNFFVIVPAITSTILSENQEPGVGIKYLLGSLAIIFRGASFVLVNSSRIAAIILASFGFFFITILSAAYRSGWLAIIAISSTFRILAISPFIPTLSLIEAYGDRLIFLLIPTARILFLISAYISELLTGALLFRTRLAIRYADNISVFSTFTGYAFLAIATLIFFLTLPRETLPAYLYSKILGPIDAISSFFAYVYPLNKRLSEYLSVPPVDPIQAVNVVVPIILVLTYLALIIAFPGTSMYRPPLENPGGRLYYLIKLILVNKKRTVATMVFAVVVIPVSIIVLYPLASIFGKALTSFIYVVLTTEAKLRRDIGNITSEREYEEFVSKIIVKALSYKPKSIVVLGYSPLADETLYNGLYWDTFREFFREKSIELVPRNDFTLAILIPSVVIISDNEKSYTRRFGEYGYKEYNVLGDYFRIPTLVFDPLSRIYEIKAIVRNSNAVLMLDARESKELIQKLSRDRPYNVAYIVRVVNTDTLARLIQEANRFMIFPIYFERIVGNWRYHVLTIKTDKYISEKKLPIFVIIDLSDHSDIHYGKAFSFSLEYFVLSELSACRAFGRSEVM